MNKWLYKEYYRYLFQKPYSLKKIYCRFKGHFNPIWFNMYGLEPDMHCEYCGDFIG